MDSNIRVETLSHHLVVGPFIIYEAEITLFSSLQGTIWNTLSRLDNKSCAFNGPRLPWSLGGFIRKKSRKLPPAETCKVIYDWTLPFICYISCCINCMNWGGHWAPLSSTVGSNSTFSFLGLLGPPCQLVMQLNFIYIKLSWSGSIL